MTKKIKRSVNGIKMIIEVDEKADEEEVKELIADLETELKKINYKVLLEAMYDKITESLIEKYWFLKTIVFMKK